MLNMGNEAVGYVAKIRPEDEGKEVVAVARYLDPGIEFNGEEEEEREGVDEDEGEGDEQKDSDDGE